MKNLTKNEVLSIAGGAGGKYGGRKYKEVMKKVIKHPQQPSQKTNFTENLIVFAVLVSVSILIAY